MTLSDLRTGWRMLVQQKAYSAVVVGGLALAFAACYLLIGYVRYCFSYDSAVPERGQVYVMKHRLNFIPVPTWIEFMPLPARELALNCGMASEVTAAVPRPVVMTTGARRVKEEITAVDPVFPAMFGVRASGGDLQAALTRPDGLALTADLARKLFDGADALGRSVTIDGKTLRVMALLPNPPANTTMPYSALVGITSGLWSEQERNDALHAWTALGGKIYVRLKPNATPAALSAVLQAGADHTPWSEAVPPDVLKKIGHVIEIDLGRLDQAFFDTEVANGFRGGVRANKAAVLALGAVALLILALAAANYVNLATVRTLRREREIGIRKVIGASGARVVRQFLAESVLVALLAGAGGTLLAWLLQPAFGELVGGAQITLFDPATLALNAAAALLVGLLAGSYPALLALRMHPGEALKGRAGSDSARALWLRRILSVLQFAVALALTGATVALAWQTRFASSIDPGFNQDGLYVLSTPWRGAPAAALALRDALQRLTLIDALATTGKPIGIKGQMKGSDVIKNAQGVDIRVREQTVSANFFTVFGIAPLAGRLLDPARDAAPAGRGLVLNMAAVRAFGFGSAQGAIGQRIDREWTVVGVAPDVRDQTVAEPVQPTLYRDNGEFGAISMRSHASLAQLHEAIAPLWARSFPDDELVIEPQRAIYAANYAEERRITKMMGAASVLAVLIAAFGIYVLAAYNVQRRQREIVLRKLHGASARAVGLLVGREFALLVGVAAVLGLPVAALAIERYLAVYVERAPMGPWPLLLALLLVALVALGATLRQTRYAMRLSPVQALRLE